MMHNAKAAVFIIAGIALFAYALLNTGNKTEEVYLVEQVLPSGEGQVVGEVGVTEPPQEIDEQENKLIIEKIGVDAIIHEGGEETLALGVWHLPRTSTPDLGGNTVISSHRWKYQPPDPRTFYDLDKLELDDKILIYWKGVEYNYVVSEIFEVTPDQVEILGPSDEDQLTLFTCTPVYSTAKRLIVKSKLEEVSKENK